MYKKSFSGWFKHGDFMLLDLLCLELSFILTKYLIRDSLMSFVTHMYRDEVIFLGICNVFVILFTEPFRNILRRSARKEFVSIVRHVILVMAVNILYLYTMHMGHFFSRRLFLYTAIGYLVISFILREGWKRFLRHRIRTKHERAMILVTTSGNANQALHDIMEKSYQAVTIPAVFLMDQESPKGFDFGGIKVRGKDEDLIAYICHRWVDEVYVDLPQGSYLPSKTIEALIGMGITTHFSLNMLNREDGSEHYLERFGGKYVVTSGLKIVSARQMIFKRVADILGGLVGCLITGILFLILAPLIKRKSPGPVFFSQVRIGKNGKKFKMYKFRSMYMDAEARKKEFMDKNKVGSDLIFKMDDDPRIIGSEKKDKNGKPKGIGNFIRKTSVDEFPQFWNVLKGDMSLVGTRPPTLDEWKKYDIGHRVRMSIKPGITGLWQVSGRSEITDFDEIVRLDTEYIQNWSVGLDLKILIRTVGVVLKHEGAV